MKRLRRWTSRGMFFLSILLAVTVLDAVLGLVYKTSNRAAEIEIIGAREAPTCRAIVILPGYVMSGALVGKAFAPYIQRHDALITVSYAERGVDPDDIYKKLKVALNTLKPKELRIYGASMGGMLARLLLDRYQRDGEMFGKVVLILDSVPGSTSDVKRPGWLYWAGCGYHGGPLSSVVWAAASTAFGSRPQLEEGTNRALVDSAHRKGAWVGLPAATTQACFIRQVPPLSKGGLVGMARRVVYLQPQSPEKDPVIRIPPSVQHWRAAFPELTLVTIEGRQGQWHLPLVERPRETVEAITAPY